MNNDFYLNIDYMPVHLKCSSMDSVLAEFWIHHKINENSKL